MIKINKEDTKKMSKVTNIDEVIIKVAVNRGMKNVLDLNKFLNASIEDLYSPFLMKDMDIGIEIIKESIKEGKKIAIYGDYDADGVTSTVIMYKALKACNANFIYHIPDRESEGYGMSSERIKILKEQGVEVILSCDNGISAIEQIDLAKQLGMKVIVTDHHELTFKEEQGERKYILPNADAIINPKRQDCTYPFKLLCGAGIALKFTQALYSALNIDSDKLYELLQYAAIGTVCDVVDLIDENRIIVKAGLDGLKNTTNIGIKNLMMETKIDPENISSYHIGFILGPCINATGRLETANLSVKLMLTEDDNEAKELAKKLYELNLVRQEMTTESVERIKLLIENSNMKSHKVILVYDEKIHESIAGIVAGKIREEYNLPTIILTKGKDMPKGSGRSIDNYNMFEELIKCKEVLHKFGGHPMAAGLSIKEENIDKLREMLNKNCTLTKEDLIPKITIDSTLNINNISEKFIKDLEILKPFGKGNPSPVFAQKNLYLKKISILGKDKNTLKFTIKLNNYSTIDALCFNRGQEFEEKLKEIYKEEYMWVMNNPKDLKMDFIFYPVINSYRGYSIPQLNVIDYRFS